MFEGDAGLLADFVVEANEGLAEIETDLLTIEAAGADIDSDLVNKVFRSIHSIKGAAGFLALHKTGELAHSMENVLTLVRNRVLIPTSAVVDQLLKSADLLKRMIGAIESSNGVDVSDHVSALKVIAAGEIPAARTPDSAQEVAPVHSAPEDSPDETTQPRESLGFQVTPEMLAIHKAEGRQIHRMQFDLLRDSDVQNIQDCIQRLKDTGEIIDSYVDDSQATCREEMACLPWHVLHATVLTADQICSFFGLDSDRVDQYDESTVPSKEPAAVAESVTAVAQAPTMVNPPANVQPFSTASAKELLFRIPKSDESSPAAASVPSSSKSEPMSAPVVEANIRVSVSVLDRLMNLAGELVLGRNQLMLAVGRDDKAALESIAGRINQVTSELQETIMQTRMQPIGNVFSKFTRVVRDLSQQLGKECSLELEGKEVELDKTIIEAIGDPLTHLVRNSVDHGLEKPDVRAAKGKTPVGTVKLTAAHQEGKVLLSISDDGAGIDADKLRKKAVEKGLITAEAASTMSDHDAIRLIFAPGFSTAEQVTAVSGRGVGMDVVKTNFERLGGTVEINTVLGKGTTITVRLPLTLAIIPSMIASCSGQRFAIPQVNISELVRVLPREYEEKIGMVNHAEVLRLRGSLLPLVRLSKLADKPPERNSMENASPKQMNIVVIESGRLRYGLVVDRLHDSEEIVVKPLGRHIKGIKSFAGATVLGDGQIALILDVGGIAARSGLNAGQNGVKNRKGLQAGDHQAIETIRTLLFSNHPGEQFAVPMSNVLRIERIQTMQIDSVAGRQVLQYRGGTLTLLNLEDCITAYPREEQTRLYVVVFRHGGREVGLVAPNILDIRDIPSVMDTVSFSEPGVMGSLILDGYAVRILDLFEIGNTCHQVGYGGSGGAIARISQGDDREAASASETQQPRILYAEDSGFFRSKVKKFLEHEGWEVIACNDGQEAWQQLQDPANRFDMLITDIEMPRMNGFELTQNTRTITRWKELPILAVTSLASDSDREQGYSVGITDYLVKIDRDQLLAAVARYLGVSLTSGH